MATAGKVPFLGFLATIRNRVWFGFGAGAATATGTQPIIELRAASTRTINLRAASTRGVDLAARSTRVVDLRAGF